MTVKLLEECDIFDFYGIEQLLKCASLDDSERRIAENRLYDIHQLYVDACKARIRSEAVFCGVDLDGEMSMEFMLGKVRDLIGQAFEQQAVTGRPVNLMATIMKANAAAGVLSEDEAKRFGVAKPEEKLDPDVDPEWFTKANGRMWDNPKWAEIAKTFVKLEAAHSIDDILEVIDYLNTLQHNSFHLLIDLQTGRMLEGRSEGGTYGEHEIARKNLQDVLDMIHKSTTAADFLSRMSEDIRDIVKDHRGSLR